MNTIKLYLYIITTSNEFKEYEKIYYQGRCRNGESGYSDEYSDVVESTCWLHKSSIDRVEDNNTYYSLYSLEKLSKPQVYTKFMEYLNNSLESFKNKQQIENLRVKRILLC